MNIKDFDAPEQMEGINYAEAIFTRQRELIEKYHHIEVANGFVSADMPTPVDLDDRFAQYRIKDFCWRVTEELMEAWEANIAEDDEHYIEELIDALHFITELCINVGLNYDQIFGRAFCDDSAPELYTSYMYSHREDPIKFENPDGETYPVGESDVMAVTYWLGMAANTLKNKPWKQSHMSTDTDKFLGCLARAYMCLVDLLGKSGMTPQGIYEVYYKKSEVNRFRQRSNY